jgi:heptose-I-phosphate ethanolaminephosphotransferase
MELVGLVTGTNVGEATEFFSSYFNTKSVCWILYFVFLPIAVAVIARHVSARFEKQIKSFRNRAALALLMIVLVPLLTFSPKYNSYSFQFRQSLFGMVCSLSYTETISEIKETNPQLDVERKTNVPNVVIVIGESHCKSRSSLYGYKLGTNPRLENIPDSLLHVFKNVESSDVHTVEAFASFMTTSEVADIPKCYECPNIIDIAKKSGYQTFWVSNQSKRGLWDNKVSMFSELCDSAVFNGKEITLIKTDYDLCVVPHVKSINDACSANSVKFVHLMGSHANFNQRYPKSFDKFKPEQYGEGQLRKRKLLAAYDNSVLYNDYVVSEIIKCFADKDAVVLYFSDHAIDLFVTDGNYCGHALSNNANSEKVSRQIPFMVYTSAKFRENHGDLTRMIEQSVDIHFNTTDLPYMVMQLLGVTFTDRANKQPLHNLLSFL